MISRLPLPNGVHQRNFVISFKSISYQQLSSQSNFYINLLTIKAPTWNDIIGQVF